MEIRNAQIIDTMMGREDHGIFTFYIFVRFGGSQCGIGGYVLDEPSEDGKRRVFRAESMEAISMILEVVGVNKWEDLKGKYIRVKDNGWGNSINEIGNLMEEKWFNIKKFFSEH